MRPQQQNRRMRGRNNNNNNGGGNNNRKGPNPLTRSYESNGPDVKIRGSAQQIAEKYTTLARDAMSSGDRVMAENYLQHAEHYNRIIAAAQAQMPIQQQGNGPRDDADEDMDDERDEFDGVGLPQGSYGNQDRQQRQGGGQNYNQGGQNNGGGAYASNQQHRAGNPAPGPERSNGAPVNHAEAPQPVIEGMPAEIALNGEGGERQARGEQARGEQGRGERHGEFRDRKRRFDNRENRGPGEAGEQPRVQPQRAEQQSELPAFVTAPIARREAPAADDAATAVADVAAASVEAVGSAVQTAEGEDAPRRGRRPRRSVRSQSEEGAPEAEREPDVAPAEG